MVYDDQNNIENFKSLNIEERTFQIGDLVHIVNYSEYQFPYTGKISKIKKIELPSKESYCAVEIQW